jgi:hypothetical protein
MPTVEEGLVAQMLATGALTTLVATRIYWGLAAQDAPRPYLTFAQIAGVRQPAMGVDTGIVQARYQITAWADTADSAKDTIAAVRGALERYRGTVDTIEVIDTFVENELGPLWDDVALAQSYVMDFLVWHRE